MTKLGRAFSDVHDTRGVESAYRSYHCGRQMV
jgi:hypothetical protein